MYSWIWRHLPGGTSIKAVTAWSKNGARYLRASKTWWFTAWSSQFATRPQRGPSNVVVMSLKGAKSFRLWLPLEAPEQSQ